LRKELFPAFPLYRGDGTCGNAQLIANGDADAFCADVECDDTTGPRDGISICKIVGINSFFFLHVRP